MDEILRYIEAHSAAGAEADNALLTELDRATNLRVIQPKMVSGQVQGAFLQLITRMLRPHRVLEIGTFTGYSALSIAAGLSENAEIHTVEVDDELEDLARSFFARSPHGHKIHLHIGSALDIVPQLVTRDSENSLNAPFDLVYIDGDKREYPDYYRMLMGYSGSSCMLRSGSIILADNVLWYGKVAAAPAPPTPPAPPLNVGLDRHTAAILEFNRMVASDSRVENVILSLRDGINFIRVK